MNPLGILVLFVLANCHGRQYSNQQRLKSTIESYFSRARYLQKDKQPSVQYTIQTWKELGIQVELQPTIIFDTENGQITKEIGFNVIGILPGRHFDTDADRWILIGAHYDTVSVTNGVDDNGSGMSALLESARILAGQCHDNAYTILFVAFDFEELYAGSKDFVNNWLIPKLTQRFPNQLSQFQGAIIFDTIMNFNNTPNAQTTPEGFSMAFPSQVDQIKANNFKGDFLFMVSRDINEPETQLANQLKQKFNSIATGKSWIVHAAAPKEIPWQSLGDLLRSDHVNFWRTKRNDISLPAVFLTDTGQFREPMGSCYHQACDNAAVELTDGNVQFLSLITDAVVETVAQMADMKCQPN